MVLAPDVLAYLHGSFFCRATGRVNNEPWSVPGGVVSVYNFLPCGERHAGNIGLSAFHPLAVRRHMATNDFHFKAQGLTVHSHLPPRVAGKLNGIDRIRNDVAAQSQIFLRDAVSHLIAFTGDGVVGHLTAQRLLNCVYAQITGPDFAAKNLGNGCFANSGQSGKNNQRGLPEMGRAR